MASSACPRSSGADAQGDPLRLTLASGPTPSPRMWLVRATAATLDAIAVSVLGALAASTGLVSFSVAALCVATVYFTAGTLLAESSPGWWFSRRWLHLKLPVAAGDPTIVAGTADEDDEDEDLEPRRAPSDVPLRGNRRDRRCSAARAPARRTQRQARPLAPASTLSRALATVALRACAVGHILPP